MGTHTQIEETHVDRHTRITRLLRPVCVPLIISKWTACLWKSKTHISGLSVDHKLRNEDWMLLIRRIVSLPPAHTAPYCRNLYTSKKRGERGRVATTHAHNQWIQQWRKFVKTRTLPSFKTQIVPPPHPFFFLLTKIFPAPSPPLPKSFFPPLHPTKVTGHSCWFLYSYTISMHKRKKTHLLFNKRCYSKNIRSTWTHPGTFKSNCVIVLFFLREKTT